MKPNVLLVVLDSVRARNTSVHDHVHDTTPFLTSFADRSTTYKNARSPATWSLPSHVSMFTGLHVPEHQLEYRDKQLASGETIWETLSEEHGYATGVFSSNPFLTAVPVGLERAFDTAVGRVDLPFQEALDPREFVREQGTGQFVSYLRAAIQSDHPIGSLANGVYEKLERDAPALLPDTIKPDPTGQLFVDAFLEWERSQSEPWAACLNLMDAHHAYEPDEEFDRWGGEQLRTLQRSIDSYIWQFNGGQRPWWQRRALEGLYDGAIRQLDSIVESLVTALEQRGALDETMLVVTGDHGEGFGERSTIRPNTRAVGHGNGASHETVLHVPLIVNYPGQTDGKVVDDVCSLTYFPTMVDGAIQDDWEAFHSADPVIAVGSGLNERTKRNAEKYCDDLSKYEGRTRILYEDGDDGLTRKYSAWKSARTTVEIRDAQTSYKTKDSVSDALESAFSGLSTRNVTEETGNVDAGVQQRLENLGYA